MRCGFKIPKPRGKAGEKETTMKPEREKLVQKATRFLIETEGKRMPNGCMPTQQMKMKWLMEEKGLTSTEYLEALNRATNGELVRTALGKC